MNLGAYVGWLGEVSYVAGTWGILSQLATIRYEAMWKFMAMWAVS